MKALIVYESMYGNTHAVSEAVAEGLRSTGEAKVVPASHLEQADFADVDLLVLGAPTHVHGLPRLSTRRSAEKAAQSSHGRLAMDSGMDAEHGIRSILDELPRGAEAALPKKAAAFDTRLSGPAMFTGSAGRKLARSLRRHGYTGAAAPASFFVDRQDHLLDGEIARAKTWGESLAGQVATPSQGA